MTLTNSATLSSKHAPVQLECVPPSGKKYKLLPKEEGEKLHRIVALIDIPEYGVKVGDLGGFVYSEANLSHTGKCWVKDEAKVFNKAIVSGNACVSGRAEVSGRALVWQNAWIADHVKVRGQAQISSHVRLQGSVTVTDFVTITGHVLLQGNVKISGNWSLYGNARIFNFTSDRATTISGNGSICGTAQLSGELSIRGDGIKIGDNTQLIEGASIHSQNDFVTVGPSLRSGRYMTAYKKKDGDVWFAVGCFDGQFDELIAAIQKKHHKDPGSIAHYRKMVKMAALYMGIPHDLP